MSEDEQRPHGLFRSLKGLLQSGGALLQNRVELFVAEVEEQKARLVKLLLLCAVTMLLGNIALLVVSTIIVLVAGPAARLPVLIGLAVVYSGGALAAYLALRRELRDAPPPFRDTVGEIKKDRACLEPPP